jgi:hypothetical protein
MTDEHANHEDIARLLREQGAVEAPPDLAASVMEEVRRTPRRPAARDRFARRTVQWAAAAVVVAAALLGLSRIDLGGGSSSSSSVGAASAGGEAQVPPKAADSSGQRSPSVRFSVGAAVARQVLGPRWSAAEAEHGRIVITVPSREFRALTHAFKRHSSLGIPANGPDIVTVVLRRSP